ncbi:MAG: hypothetical protein QM499_09520 [Flavobacteriaceae bacterium]
MLLQLIGAFLVWTAKGFTGKFDDEMTGPGDHSFKSYRNIALSILFLYLVFSFLPNN